MTIVHSSLATVNHHKPGYVQSGDPGAVGAGIAWVDTSGSPWLLKIRNGTDTGWETIGPLTHASGHITGGGDEIDGDKLDIDWTPSNYTPSTTPSEADNADNLTAHLYGIDQELAAGGGTYDYLLYRHTQTQNTAGGTATSGSDQTLPMTEETVDTGGDGSLSSNQITLAAGTYRFVLQHVFYTTLTSPDIAQIWLYNVSDTADITDSEGTSILRKDTAAVATARGRFTLAASKTIEARYRVTFTQSTNGLGYPGNFREECYGFLMLIKEP